MYKTIYLGDDNAQYYIIQKFFPSSPQTGHVHATSIKETAYSTLNNQWLNNGFSIITGAVPISVVTIPP